MTLTKRCTHNWSAGLSNWGLSLIGKKGGSGREGPDKVRKANEARLAKLKAKRERKNKENRLYHSTARREPGISSTNVMNVTKDDITTYLKQVLNDGAEYAKADGLKTIGEWFPGVDLEQLASQEFGAMLESDSEWEEFERLLKEVVAEVCTPE